MFSLIADCLNPHKSARAKLSQLFDKLDNIANDNNENLGKPVAMFTDDYRYDVDEYYASGRFQTLTKFEQMTKLQGETKKKIE